MLIIFFYVCKVSLCQKGLKEKKRKKKREREERIKATQESEIWEYSHLSCKLLSSVPLWLTRTFV